MFVVELVATLGAGRRLTDDEITDLIELVVDDLDRDRLQPSVSTVRLGDDVEMTVSVAVDAPDEISALDHAVSAVRAAFRTADIGTSGGVVPRDLRSHVSPLQPA